VVGADGRRYILRRPPLGHLLPSAHDVAREARIMRALSTTDVPVPEVLALCEDLDVTGCPFDVMAFVDGLVVRDTPEAAAMSGEARAAAADNVARALAALHAVDPAAVGLETLGRSEDYVARQLRRWERQRAAVVDAPMPTMDEAHRRLAAAIPPQRGAGIVHGDYRLDNLVLGPDADVRAILDWELCALGDVRADVAMLALYWVSPGEPVNHLLSATPTRVGGFGSRDALLDAYARHSGVDLAELDYFVAFQCWRLACIAGGIRARYASGAMGDESGFDVANLDAKIAGLAEASLQTLFAAG
jgi:aminoglycoside phosphotransferase (APT) family kinase protein